ncbi:MAG: family 43 glycosylhydrolase [Clostridia bacterium]|nr:family 43 glycosylhydrolase [Clostridia bacterium]
MIIETHVTKLRDPYVVVKDGIYYAYGTGWQCYVNKSGRLDGEWKRSEVSPTVIVPEDFVKQNWAPEVHVVNGKYYMFTTYFSSKTQHRGCSVFCADQPEGPFVQISDGHFTPHDWDCIDATLYIDENGQPWSIFVHEWTCRPDHVGLMSVAKMSDDLTHLISEPVDLFRADDAPWANAGVTDGCFIYRTQGGKLLMIWSNFAEDGYAVGIAESEDGRPDGKWLQREKRLYGKTDAGYPFDGGHGMLFADTDGQLYLSMHSSNTPVGERDTTMVFLRVKEQDDNLVPVY